MFFLFGFFCVRRLFGGLVSTVSACEREQIMSDTHLVDSP